MVSESLTILNRCGSCSDDAKRLCMGCLMVKARGAGRIAREAIENALEFILKVCNLRRNEILLDVEFVNMKSWTAVKSDALMLHISPISRVLKFQGHGPQA